MAEAAKILGKTIVLFLFVGLIGAAGVLYFVYQTDGPGENKDILIPRGMTVGQIIHRLEQENVIRHPKLFKLVIKLTRGEHKIRAGEFRFKKGGRMTDALWALYYSEPITHQVTIPEGWTARQIAHILGDAKLVDEAKFVDSVLSPQGPAKFKLTAPTLEGFLFPDTYAFSLIDGEEKIIERMVQRFQQKFAKSFEAEVKAKGWTIEQLVTLASIIEKETGASGERELISSVFHNRLKKKMRLQSDPTTIYGIPNFNGNLTKKDLQTHTPYNTYTIPALPPGAIASPGYDALVAALHPATTDYLYFVSNNRGGHIFSKTYEQHNRHVNTFQKAPAPRPSKAIGKRNR